MNATPQQIDRFQALFRSNARSYGSWNPKTREMLTVKQRPIPREAYAAHLNGYVGLGGVPILDDGTCWWGAIDVDVHGPNARDVDLVKISNTIEQHQLPGIVCRTKSGGAHVYAFFSEPAPCAGVRPMLARWAALLGYPHVEIFPKQDKLEPDQEGARPLGSWLNFPYFNIAKTERFCVVGGKHMDFDYFLDLAEGYKQKFQVDDTMDLEYGNGPPCLQEMIKVRVESGSRNTAVYQAAVYLKRAFADDWKDRVKEFNAVAMQEPLNTRELRQITGSVAKRDYQYKCREEPCKSLCNKDLCKTREFGISSDDEKANELPPFEKIEKVIATPVRWVLHMKGAQIELDTVSLFDYARVRTTVFEKLNLVLPRMKNDEWDTFLREIGANATTRHEVTLEDTIFTKLCDFLRRANSDRQLPEDDRRQALLRRMPALISLVSESKFKPRGQVNERGDIETVRTEWYYAFRAQDFIDFMRRHKSLTIPEHQVHTVLHKTLGKDKLRDRFYVDEKCVRNVWLILESEVSSESVPAKKFESEF